MKEQLRKPEYWADFEDLCKKLWGEIWMCPDIKKNGRLGQAQNGVDIYGKAYNEKEYSGIQCKGKNLYTHANLTKAEVDKEIEKAKNFRPQLTRFIIATTANKDASIEEYVRLKDIETNFQIAIYFWEDIVDLIDENRSTHNWYVRKLNFRQNHKIQLTFSHGSNNLLFTPTFIKEKVRYISKEFIDMMDTTKLNIIDSPFLPKIRNKEDLIKLYKKDWGEEKEEDRNNPQPIRFSIGLFANQESYENLSTNVFQLRLKNIGTEVFEDFKVYLYFDNVESIDTVDKREKLLDTFKYKYNTFFSSNSSGIIEPYESVLVQNDELVFDKICFKTKPQKTEITLTWKFFSRDFEDNGVLKMQVNPKFEKSETHLYDETVSPSITKSRIRNKYKFY